MPKKAKKKLAKDHGSDGKGRPRSRSRQWAEDGAGASSEEAMTDTSSNSFTREMDQRAYKFECEVEVRVLTSGLTICEAKKLALLGSATKERMQCLHLVSGLNWDLDAGDEITPKPQQMHVEILEKWIEEEASKHKRLVPGVAVGPDLALWSLCKLLLVTLPT